MKTLERVAQYVFETVSGLGQLFGLIFGFAAALVVVILAFGWVLELVGFPL